MPSLRADPSKSAVAWAAIDMLGCLLLVLLVLMQPTTRRTPPRIETDGQYAVTIEWADGSPNDVDLYVEDPDNNVCYFGADHISLMNLENDDLGNKSDSQRKVKLRGNHERIIMRGSVTGEYTVNVHMFQRDGGPNPERVRVRIWRLRGDDTMVRTQIVELRGEGDQQTAFRFTLNANGDITGFSRLSKDLVGNSTASDSTGFEHIAPTSTPTFPSGNGTSGP